MMHSPESSEFLFHFKLVHEAINIVGTYNGSEYTNFLVEVHFFGLKIRLFWQNRDISIKYEDSKGIKLKGSEHWIIISLVHCPKARPKDPLREVLHPKKTN